MPESKKAYLRGQVVSDESESSILGIMQARKKGIRQGLKPHFSRFVKRAKPKGLAYPEAKTILVDSSDTT